MKKDFYILIGSFISSLICWYLMTNENIIYIIDTCNMVKRFLVGICLLIAFTFNLSLFILSFQKIWKSKIKDIE